MYYVKTSVNHFKIGRLLVFLFLYFCLVLAATSYNEENGILGNWKRPGFLKTIYKKNFNPQLLRNFCYMQLNTVDLHTPFFLWFYSVLKPMEIYVMMKIFYIYCDLQVSTIENLNTGDATMMEIKYRASKILSASFTTELYTRPGNWTL